jgi:stage III sporulation protein SpoIIIAA
LTQEVFEQRLIANEFEITDDLEALLSVLPPELVDAVRRSNKQDELLEVILDLGRRPEARYLSHEVTLSSREMTTDDLDYVVTRIGDFGEDNRAGIERTLHRISAIRNRKGVIVGLTCRVGRAVYGTIDIIKDIIQSGRSVLLLGRPGVGKTTMLREVARVLAETKRVVIVDTSNEIGGDGDIPHPAIGRARRMQVVTPVLQHEVMIEAVENHMPEVIVIDEIGRELEAEAARTIAERGVQLVGTAHGQTLDNLMMNPTLADLVGGIQSVTLSDEEARRRGTQKSVLERKAPPTFDVLIEIKDWQHLAIHHDVAQAVDAILRGRSLPAEIRYRDETGSVQVEMTALPPPDLREAPTMVDRAQRAPEHSLRKLNVYAHGVRQKKLF